MIQTHIFGSQSWFSLVVFSFFLSACHSQYETPNDQVTLLNLETLPPVTDPINNLSNPDKVILGKMLFWDPILSGEKDVACVSCHHPRHGYADGLDVSIGVGGNGLGNVRTEGAKERIPRVGRNAPTIINAAYNGLLSYHQIYNPLNAPTFWDGRRKSLEFQSLGPPTSYNEMRGNGYEEALTFDSLVNRLQNIPAYVTMFQAAFGGDISSVNEENIGKAIAAFERTIISRNSPYDQFVNGDKNALSEDQKNGLLLFFNKANCATCHAGPMFSDYNYYNLGIRDNDKVGVDLGVNEQRKFRTPTLRNVTLTAPYMHNGAHQTLEEMMEYYNNGISENAEITAIDPKIKPLNLNKKEISDIIAFMEALTDDSFDKSEPASVPSGLKPGGNL
ncbi:cytochrome c peroxidase [Fulvivirgaceae bacterium BMA12]|uniref:Cytochrome c peroxidase n=1 Tax=Agaribacillus aureus TaxID=3051825 RepID=A0ABT8L920_9BACT|nr:cytochrome c peroxidase [Fulvivirgaceae bacterium BMA12]